MNHICIWRDNFPFGINIFVEIIICNISIDYFDRADFNNAIATHIFKPSRFNVKADNTFHIQSQPLIIIVAGIIIERWN